MVDVYIKIKKVKRGRGNGEDMKSGGHQKGILITLSEN